MGSLGMGYVEVVCLKIVYMGFLVFFGVYCVDVCLGIMMNGRMIFRNYCM